MRVSWWLLGCSLLAGCSRVAPVVRVTPAPVAATPVTSPRDAAPRGEAELQAALARDVHDASAYEGLARLYYERSLTERSYVLLARRVIDQGLAALARRGRTSGDLLATRGLLALADGRTDRAISDFTVAVRLDAHDLRAQAALAATALHVRDFVRAQPAFAFVVTSPRGRTDAAAWMGLGMAEQGVRNFVAAERAFRRASELAPADPRPHYHLGLLAARASRTPDGLDDGSTEAHFERARELGLADRRFLEIVDKIDEWRDRRATKKICACHYPIGWRCHTEDELAQQDNPDPRILAAYRAESAADDAVAAAELQRLLHLESAALAAEVVALGTPGTAAVVAAQRERLLHLERAALAAEVVEDRETAAARASVEREALIDRLAAERAETARLRLREREAIKDEVRAGLR